MKGVLVFITLFLLHGFVFGQEEKLLCKKLEAVRQLIHEDEPEQAEQLLATTAVATKICKAESDFLRGTIQHLLGNDVQAVIFLKQSFEQFEALKSENGLVKVLFQLSLSSINLDDFAMATVYLDKALQFQSALFETGLFHEVMDVRAMLFTREGNHPKAMKLLKDAARFAISSGDTTSSIQLLNQIATNHQITGSIDSTIFYYEELIKIKKQANDFAGLLSDFSTLGGLQRELGDYKNAQSSFIQAIHYAEFLQDTLSLVIIYTNIGNVYFEEGLLDLAYKHIEKAFSFAQMKNMLLSEGQCLSLEGDILTLQNLPQKALSKYESALEVYEKLGLAWPSAQLLVKMAAISPGLDALSKAENLLWQEMNQRTETGDKLGLLNAKLLLSEVMLRQNKSYKQVESWLNECELWAKETQNLKDLMQVYLLKSQLNEKNNQFKTALSWYKKYGTIQDSLLAIENIREVRRLEKQFETVKKDKEIAEQQIVLEKQTSSLNTKKTQVVLLLISLGFTVALIILIGFVYRRNRQLSHQKLDMLRKERESEVLRAMISGEEKERLRIARDLHDSLGAVMATIKMRIGALSNHFPDISKADNYRKAEELVDDAYGIVREISHNMVPGALSKYGLEQAIGNMCEALESSQGIQVEFIAYNLDELDDDLIETNVYRMVQELIQNIRKHSGASEVIVQIAVEDNQLELTVEDNGKGFDPDRITETIGMESIRSRVKMLNGTIEITAAPGKGSTFLIHIPVNSKQNKPTYA